jgi:hypothetical protein
VGIDEFTQGRVVASNPPQSGHVDMLCFIVACDGRDGLSYEKRWRHRFDAGHTQLSRGRPNDGGSEIQDGKMTNRSTNGKNCLKRKPTT